MVKFDCDPGYVLTGERRRWCYETGDWNWAENGNAYCTREYSFYFCCCALEKNHDDDDILTQSLTDGCTANIIIERKSLSDGDKINSNSYSAMFKAMKYSPHDSNYQRKCVFISHLIFTWLTLFYS